MRNAFLLTDDPRDVEKGRARGVTDFTVATRFPERFDGVEVYKLVEKPSDADFDKIALLTLEKESLLDAVIDSAYENGANTIVAACYDLTETGRIQARTGLNPIQLLHREGLLDRCAILGGNHLDRDDVELMRVCGTPLIACVTASQGYGHGSPRIRSLSGLKVSLGSGDNAFNAHGDMLLEARALLLGSNCEMRSRDSVTPEFVLDLISAKADDPYAALYVKKPLST